MHAICLSLASAQVSARKHAESDSGAIMRYRLMRYRLILHFNQQQWGGVAGV